MKRDSLDALFSLYVRTRDRWTCQRCFKPYPEKHQGLHSAHLFGRGKMSVRWTPLNAVALCYGCHRHLDTHPLEKAEWAKQRLGEEPYYALGVQARTPTKVDRAAVKLVLQLLLQQVLKSDGDSDRTRRGR